MFDEASGTWRELDREVAGNFRAARLALQLVNRAGPVAPETLAQFRDALGVGRKTAQLYLERFDADGVTRRVGDARVLRRRSGG